MESNTLCIDFVMLPEVIVRRCGCTTLPSGGILALDSVFGWTEGARCQVEIPCGHQPGVAGRRDPDHRDGGTNSCRCRGLSKEEKARIVAECCPPWARSRRYRAGNRMVRLRRRVPPRGCRYGVLPDSVLAPGPDLSASRRFQVAFARCQRANEHRRRGALETRVGRSVSVSEVRRLAGTRWIAAHRTRNGTRM